MLDDVLPQVSGALNPQPESTDSTGRAQPFDARQYVRGREGSNAVSGNPASWEALTFKPDSVAVDLLHIL